MCVQCRTIKFTGGGWTLADGGTTLQVAGNGSTYTAFLQIAAGTNYNPLNIIEVPVAVAAGGDASSGNGTHCYSAFNITGTLIINDLQIGITGKGAPIGTLRKLGNGLLRIDNIANNPNFAPPNLGRRFFSVSDR